MFEVLHSWAHTRSTSYEVYRSVLEVGQYLTIVTLLVMVHVFSMRLRFVLSAVGKYYEEMLALHPEEITRYRDEIDNMIVRYFFKGKKYLGRLASTVSNHVHTTNKQEH